MIISDSVIRLLKGSINDESSVEESFETIIRIPTHTLPREYDGDLFLMFYFVVIMKLLENGA